LAAAGAEPAPAPPQPPRRTSPLERVDLSKRLDKDDYSKELDDLQAEVRRLQHICYTKRTPVVMVFEGWDAGGKGGAIRRMVRELDPRGYEVVPVGPPEGDEKRRHYLWRFWRSLPKGGHFAVFDRSWYGRVLVERVEGFATPQEWNRAYREINEFEAEVADFGAVVAKFWLHISKEEQLQRFEARQEDPHKQWKITEEDWRNREKWDQYWHAVSDMIERTSTPLAPWTIVEGDDKRYARVKVLRTITSRLKQVLE
jgi:polyphosphate kinase 2 (PPK2 family)